MAARSATGRRSRDPPRRCRYLKQHFKLVILSNVDHESFAASNEQTAASRSMRSTPPRTSAPTSPTPRNFDYMLARPRDARGREARDPAYRRRACSTTTGRRTRRAGLVPGSTVGTTEGFGATMRPGEMPNYDFRFTSLAESSRRTRNSLALEQIMTGTSIRPRKPSPPSARRSPRPDSHAQSRATARARRLSGRARGDRREAYAAYGRESGPVFARLGGKIVWRGRFELMLIGPRGALGSLLHRAISERRRFRRDDPRSRLSRGGQAPAGGGGGFAADPARAGRGGSGLRLRS